MNAIFLIQEELWWKGELLFPGKGSFWLIALSFLSWLCVQVSYGWLYSDLLFVHFQSSTHRSVFLLGRIVALFFLFSIRGPSKL